MNVQVLYCPKCDRDLSIGYGTKLIIDGETPQWEIEDGHIISSSAIVSCPIERQFIDLVDHYSRSRDDAARDYYATMQCLEESRQRETQKLLEKCGPNSILFGEKRTCAQ